jgi:hypothetical protein
MTVPTRFEFTACPLLKSEKSGVVSFVILGRGGEKELYICLSFLRVRLFFPLGKVAKLK